ncbi:MAG: hypothetical protein CM15mP83_4740 [Flavobacteriaceae bacterium]|nr:MAG: hypothetical protein CM15mP83_4740 [Flavobacteriaceae bacterium]
MNKFHRFSEKMYLFWFRIYHRGHCKHSKYESAFLYLMYIGSSAFGMFSSDVSIVKNLKVEIKIRNDL